MKKTYIQPCMEVISEDCPMLLSGSIKSSNDEIGYGGVDDGGTKDPSSRRFGFGWDDEDEE